VQLQLSIRNRPDSGGDFPPRNTGNRGRGLSTLRPHDKEGDQIAGALLVSGADYLPA
jgi:hypothetical protein